MTAGISHFRVEFVDEKPEDVVKVINMYQDVCKNIEMLQSSDDVDNLSRNTGNSENKKNIAERNIESTLGALWKFLEIVPNGHGLPQGVSLGSLKPTLERNWDSLKPTARR